MLFIMELLSLAIPKVRKKTCPVPNDTLQQADTCVLVLPCGRSAHTEAGWMAGAGKRVIAYIPEMVEPELMYKLFDRVVGNLNDLVQCLCYDGETK